MRSAFDIIGPIMIGPSSSHTAGAVRLGLMARAILGEEVKIINIKLYGSFAQTYKGHGTDRALIAGIMGFKPDDERIRNSLEIAKEKNIEFNFSKVDLEDAHPNTAIIELIGVTDRKIEVTGASIGGGNIIISAVNNYSSSYTVDGDIFNILSISMTKKSGTSDKIAAEIEYLNMLQNATSYKINGNQLIIYTLLSNENLVFEEF